MNEDCVLWERAKSGNGYGVRSVDGKMCYVHRLAWSERHGPIPPKMVIAHTCDTPACYNPDHLFLCTQAENLADMKAKGRSASGDRHGSKTKPERFPKGERVGTSKLTALQVEEIRSLYERGTPGRTSPNSLTGLAGRYGVQFQTISKIINNKAWK